MRKAVLSVLLLCVCLLISAFLMSCYDSPDSVLISHTFVVSGKVIGGPHNAGAPNVFVMIGDKTVMTDADGYFSIGGVSSPYDIYVSDTLNKTASLFEGLDYTQRVFLPNYVKNPVTNVPTASVEVKLKYQHPINKFKIYFTDDISVYGIGGNTTDTSGLCTVYLPDNKPVTGKIAVLKYTTDNNGNVTAFNRFGYINGITISPNSTVTVAFPDTIFRTNPGTLNSSGTITNIPSGCSMSASMFVILGGRELDFDYQSAAIQTNIPASFTLQVPYNISLPFTKILNVIAYDSANPGAAKGFVNSYLDGGTGFSFPFPDNSYIVSPPNNSAINENTVFSQSSQPYGPISMFVFTDSVRTFNVYTKSMSTSMKNFHKFGFGLFPYNSTIKFTAKIIGRYYSVGSYLDIRRNITYGYEALSATNSYLFLN